MRDARLVPRILLMPQLPATRPILPGETLTPVGAATHWLRTSWPGRILLLGLLLKIIQSAGTAVSATPRPSILEGVDRAGTLAVVVGGGYALPMSHGSNPPLSSSTTSYCSAIWLYNFKLGGHFLVAW